MGTAAGALGGEVGCLVTQHLQLDGVVVEAVLAQNFHGAHQRVPASLVQCAAQQPERHRRRRTREEMIVSLVEGTNALG